MGAITNTFTYNKLNMQHTQPATNTKLTKYDVTNVQHREPS